MLGALEQALAIDGAAARADMEARFSPERMVAEYVAAYEALLAGHLSGGGGAGEHRVEAAIRSLIASMPTEMRMRSSGTSNPEPSSDACVIAPGCSIRLSTPPRLSASDHTPVSVSACVGRGAPAVHAEADHAPEAAHLPPGHGVARIALEARVEDLGDGRRRREQRRDALRVVAVALHAHRERLQAAQREEAVERRRNPAERVLEEAQPLAHRAIARADEAADDVGVAADVLGRRVHDDVGAQLERLLQVRARERVVDDQQRRRRRARRRRSRAMSSTFSSGFVGVSIQTMAGRSVAMRARPTGVGEVGVGEAVAAWGRAPSRTAGRCRRTRR